MQRPYLLVAITRVEFVDKKEYALATLLKIIAWTLRLHQSGRALADAESTSMQSLLIPLMSSEILLIFLHLILRLSFPSDQ